MLTDRRTLLTAGAIAWPVAAAAGPQRRERGYRLIATEEAFATQAWLDATERLPLSGPEGAERRFLHTLQALPPIRQGLLDFERRVKVMDETNVDMHLLSLTTPGVQSAGLDGAAALARLTNDGLADIIRRHPGRFAGLASVAPQEPAAAAAEIERAMTTLGMNGVLINSYTDGAYLDAPRFDPILAALARHNAPLYLHPRVPAPDMVQPYGDYGLLGALWGFAADTGLHAMRMIMSGVFDRYPKLTVVLGHMGEAIPYWFWRIDNMYSKSAASPSAGARRVTRLKKLPSQYFRDNFYITTSGVNSHANLRFAIDLLGADRIMFAIDYPFESSADSVAFFESAPISESDRAKIAHRNAERVFRIKPA